MCGIRWYAVDGIMETLHFPRVDLIENAYPPRLMIKQVEHQQDEAKDKIQGLDHITIEGVDQLIRQPLAIDDKIHIYIYIWHKLVKMKWKTINVMLNLVLNQLTIPTLRNC